mgnify:CR=1 FL=1
MSTFYGQQGEHRPQVVYPRCGGQAPGKTAAAAATLLRGKHKPEFTPHADCGDFVVIVNAEKAVLTGKKLEQKYYRRHSGWIGGLKETKYRLLMQQKPELAMQLAVRGMLPRNIITKDSLSRLHIYRGAEHPHHRPASPETLGRPILSRRYKGMYKSKKPYLYGTGRRKSSVAPGASVPPTAPARSPSTAATSTITSAWRP